MLTKRNELSLTVDCFESGKRYAVWWEPHHSATDTFRELVLANGTLYARFAKGGDIPVKLITHIAFPPETSA